MLSSLPMPAGEGQRVGTLALICCPRISGARAIFVGRTGKIVGMAIGQKADDMPKKLTIKRDNTIANRRPDLLEEWDWEKNAELGLDPSVLLASSDEQTWWKCQNAPHSYHVRTSNKTYNNQGCPVCAGKQLLLGVNDLLSQRHDIAAEWDDELNDGTPSEYTTSSGQLAHWICPTHGTKWSACINARVRNGSMCPDCRKESIARKNSRPKPGGRYLADEYPNVAAQWCYERNGDVTPETVASKSSKAFWWTCPDCGNVYKSIVGNRTRLGEGCLLCARRETGRKNAHPRPHKSLGELHPELISEWHPTRNGENTPYNVTSRSSRKFWWKCSKCGCEYEAKPSSRVRAKVGCPDCMHASVGLALAKPKAGQSLGELYPDIASEWHPTNNGDVTPYDVAKRSSINRWWKCSTCGFEWQATPGNRVGELCGCPECSKRMRTSFPEKALAYYIGKYFVDMEENAHPEALAAVGMELDIWLPSQSTAVEYDGQYWHRSTDRDLLKDRACHDAGIRLIRVREPECPALDDSVSEIILRGDCRGYADLDEAVRECLIKLGVYDDIDVDSCRDSVAIATMLGRGIKQNGTVQEMFPEVAAEWHPTKNGDLRPDMFTPGTATKVWWLCPECGNEYETRISHRCEGHGCRRCASRRTAAKRATPKAGESLLEKYPEIAAEWHPVKNGDLTPSDVRAGSHRSVWWKCSSCGREWKTSVDVRTGATGKPLCHTCKLKGLHRT